MWTQRRVGAKALAPPDWVSPLGARRGTDIRVLQHDGPGVCLPKVTHRRCWQVGSFVTARNYNRSFSANRRSSTSRYLFRMTTEFTSSGHYRSRDELIEQAVRHFFDERQRGQQRFDALCRISQRLIKRPV
jgi:hypothetical protein